MRGSNLRMAAAVLIAGAIAGCNSNGEEPIEATSSPYPVSDSDPTPTPPPAAEDTGVITITVTDAAGDPLPGAFIEPAPIDVPAGAGFEEMIYSTDENGQYTFGALNPGLYEISVRYETELIDEPMQVTVEPGATADVEFTHR